jgi:hypothetical protein
MPDPRHQSRAPSPALLRGYATSLALVVLLASRHRAEAQGLPCASTTGLIEAAASKIASEGALQTGGAADFLINEGVARACKQGEAARWLPATCGTTPGAQALVALRRRLLVDLATMPRRLLPGPMQQGASDAERRLRMASALLEALIGGGDLKALGQALVGATALEVRSDAGCPGLLGKAGDEDDTPLRQARRPRGRPVSSLLAASIPDRPAPQPGEPLVAAARLLQKLSQEDPALPRPDDEYVALIVGELVQAGVEASDRLAPGRREEALRLIQAARRLRELRGRLGAMAHAPQYVALARALAEVLVPAVGLTARRPVGLPARLPAFVEALAAGRLGALVPEAAAMGAEAGGQPLPPEVAEAARLGAALATARSEDEVKRKLRARLLPWSEPWMFDLNGSIPRLESGGGRAEQSLFGDLSLGYHGEGWGVAGRAMYSLYNREAAFVLQRNQKGFGDLEGWFDWRLSGSLRAETRVSGGLTYYETRYENLVRSNFQLDRETSTVGRGTMLGALRWVPGPNLAAGIWLGAGGQYEDYRASNLVSLADRGQTSQQATRLLLESRLRFQWHLLPGILGARLRADATRFSITRNRRIFDVGTTITNETRTTSATQLDLNTRLFVDIEALGFLGFLPSAHVGLDLYQQTDEQQSVRILVPLLGAGLKRESF